MALQCYDVCIVGAGLIGAAAARHATMIQKDKKILLIGPEEPKDRSQTDIFGAHYDEGRITREIDRDPTWVALAKHSIGRYRSLEMESGVTFYHEVGYVTIGPENGNYLKDSGAVGKRSSLSITALNSSDFHQRFPYIKLQAGESALLTTKNAGYINPRALLRAQLILAQKHGCTYVKDIVNKVTKFTSADGSSLLQIFSDSGQIFYARRVLLATGAFTDCRSLLPDGISPSLFKQQETVVLVELAHEAEQTLRAMPSLTLSYDSQVNFNSTGEPKAFLRAFCLPPLKYPNGKVYLKLGHGNENTIGVNTSEEITRWFRSRGDPEKARELVDSFHKLFPGIKAKNYVVDCCLTSQTPTGKPFIDMVTPEIGVALGGCGYAAKSSDEIGNVAARMILKGAWDYNIPAKEFSFIAAKRPSKL